MPRFEGRNLAPKRQTSLGLALHAEALANALVAMLEALPDLPSHRRVAIRTHLGLLMQAYPELEARSQLDAEQFLAEEDGDAVQDQDP